MSKIICRAPRCGRLARTKGVCYRHYQQLRLHGRFLTEDEEYSRLPERCAVEGCDAKPLAKGLCMRHYGQKRRKGTVTHVELRKPQPCSVCSGKHYARGYCRYHYTRWQHWRKVLRKLILAVRPDLTAETSVALTTTHTICLFLVSGHGTATLTMDRVDAPGRTGERLNYEPLKDRLYEELKHIPKGGGYAEGGEGVEQRDGDDQPDERDDQPAVRPERYAHRDSCIRFVRDYLRDVRGRGPGAG